MLYFLRNLYKNGITFIPTKNKIPQIKSWGQYQNRMPTPEEIKGWLANNLFEQVAILTGDLFCIDFDNKVPTLKDYCVSFAEFLEANNIKYYCEATKSNGMHFFLHTEANTKLALYKSQKLACNEQGECFIETKGLGGYVVVAPSPGYRQVVGDLCELKQSKPITEQDLLKILHFLRKFDKNQSNNQQNKKIESKNVDNNQNVTNFIANNNLKIIEFFKQKLSEKGWEIIKEDDKYIEFKRPGGTGVTGGLNKEGLFFKNFSTETNGVDVKSYRWDNFLRKTLQMSKTDFKKMLRENNIYIIGGGVKKIGCFIVNKKGNIQNIIEGFGKFVKDKIGLLDENSKEIYIIENNIIKKITKAKFREKIKKILIKKFKKRKLNTEIVKQFTETWLTERKLNYVISHLSLLEYKLLKDTKEEIFIPFANCVVKITKDKIEKLSYKEIDSQVFETNIIKKEFEINKETSNFEKFIKNVAGENFDNLKKVIGYLIHNYSDVVNKKMVLFKDKSSLNGDKEANGRTGKSLIMQAIGKIRNVGIIDGKIYDPKNRFAFEGISKETNICFIDDVNSNFDINFLFNKITGGFTIEKKFQGSIYVSQEDAPKIAVASNYYVDDQKDQSTRARVFTFYLENYYNSIKTPFDDFKERFFDDWDEDQWNKFYNFMINCCQCWLVDQKLEAQYKDDEILLQALNSLKVEVRKTLLNKILKDLYILQEIQIKDYISNMHSRLISKQLQLVFSKLKIKYAKERRKDGYYFVIENKDFYLKNIEEIEKFIEDVISSKDFKNIAKKEAEMLEIPQKHDFLEKLEDEEFDDLYGQFHKSRVKRESEYIDENDPDADEIDFFGINDDNEDDDLSFLE